MAQYPYQPPNQPSLQRPHDSDNPPAPPQHQILPSHYSISPQNALQHSASLRYQMSAARPPLPLSLQSAVQPSTQYGSATLPLLPPQRQTLGVYPSYLSVDGSAVTPNPAFSFVTPLAGSGASADPHLNNHIASQQPLPNPPSFHAQAPTSGSVHPTGYIASPTVGPAASIIGNFDRLAISSTSQNVGATRGYNPADYAAHHSSPQQVPMSPTMGPMGGLTSPLMSPAAPTGFGSLGGFSNPIATYNPANYAVPAPAQNGGAAVHSSPTYSPEGAFSASGYAGGAYGPAQSYAIGSPNARLNDPSAGSYNPSLGGWGYGGLQSLYVPSNPPPLPTFPGLQSEEVEADDLDDDWEEREWEEHEREWELEQARFAAAAVLPNSLANLPPPHPLPRIPVEEEEDDDDDENVYRGPHSKGNGQTGGGADLASLENQRSPGRVPYSPYRARSLASGNPESSPTRSQRRHTKEDISPLQDASLDALFKETEAAFRADRTARSPDNGNSKRNKSSPVLASATLSDGDFNTLGYMEGIYDYGHDFDHNWANSMNGSLFENNARARRKPSFEVGDETRFVPGRPLPALPSSSAASNTDEPNNSDLTLVGSVPRSASLVWRPNNLEVVVPVRSKTNPSEHVPMAMNMNAGIGADPMTGLALSAVDRNSAMDMGLGMVDLPALPPVGRRFVPAKLGSVHFDKCAEPWAYSGLIRWLKEVTEGEQDLKAQALVDGLVRLFTHKIPTMNTADAEMLAADIVANLGRVGVLEQEEEWVGFTAGTLHGVVVQLTGAGCYSARGHSGGYAGVGVVGAGGKASSMVLTGRCYSRTCQRTIRKIELRQSLSQSTKEEAEEAGDWVSFYQVTSKMLEGVDKHEIERQNVLHEIVLKEDVYRRQLGVLSDVFREGIRTAQPPIIEPSRIPGFLEVVFGRLDAVRAVNEESLLPQLKYRQLEQGPWIIGFSDIFREWIRKSRSAYIAYASAYPHAEMIFRREIQRNLRFRTFVEEAQNDPRCGRLEWRTYLYAPIPTLQRYSLLLQRVLKKSTNDDAEVKLLQKAIDEIVAVTRECDDQVAEMQNRTLLLDLKLSLKLRPHMNSDLRLDQLGREVLHRGSLFRPRANRLGWIETYAVLFDHCLVLAKSGRTGYDVSRLPIPIDLLVLDTSASTGGPTTGTTLSLGITGMRSGEDSNAGSNGLTPSGTAGTNTDVEKPLFQFRIQHLGNDTYNLFTTSAVARNEWCAKITAARVSHAAALRAQNAEPFKVRVLADSAFAYDAASANNAATTSIAKPTLVTGSPLDRALREVEGMYSGPRPAPICRAKVNCAVTFTYVANNSSPGVPVVAVGTDIGIFVTDLSNPRGWVRAVQCGKVSQLAAMEQFTVLLALVDKSLAAYPLDLIGGAVASDGTPSSREGGESETKRHIPPPQKVSGGRGDVGFFVIGRMKDRVVVFYKKRDGLSSVSVFKVMEPVATKSSSGSSSSFASSALSSWSSVFRQRQAETFREYDKFYIPSECTNLSLFNSSVAVTTARGFEVLTLDKKQTWSVPNLEGYDVKSGVLASSAGVKQGLGGGNAASSPAGATAAASAAVTSLTASIASRIQGQIPLSMFRLSDQEFLVCYSSRAVYVDRYGDVSRSVVMEFVGKAKTAAMFGNYLVLFDPSFVEIRSVGDGRLRQVIAGRDVRCLDDGRGVLPPDPATLNILNGPSMRRNRLNGNTVSSTVSGGGGGTHTTNVSAGAVHAAAMAERNRTIKFAMRHPEIDRIQLVLELVLEEGSD